MNRNGNGNGLPFHFNNTSSSARRPGLSSTPSSSSLSSSSQLNLSSSNLLSNNNNSSSSNKRLSRAKFLLLVGLGVLSLLAFGKLFKPQQDHIPLDGLDPSSPSSPEETSDELERELIVQQIMETRKSAYSFEDFTEEGLQLARNEHLLPATAILLGWKRIQGLKLIVSYLVRYPYIKQIIVWNNNKEVHLSRRDFELDSSFGPLPDLQVYNAAENLHDFAKYMSCSLAKYEHCYFQDDDWLNTHMDALYTNFLTSPNYNMHAGFSWMGTGSYLPREKAQRLMKQRGNTTLAKDRFKVIDMYFSIWTNQYPYQLVNYLTPLDQKNGWSPEGVNDHWSIVFRNMLDAADRLYSALLANFEVTGKDPFVRREETPFVRDRHTRSPCFNDKCLFMTSIDPFPDPKEVVFKGDLQTVEDQSMKFLELDYPTAEFWKTFAYVHAVDNDPLTCWNSYKIPQAGDSFGLRFVKPTLLNRLTVVSSKALTSLEGQITVLASDQHGVHWTTCQYTARYPFVHTMALEISCPPVDSLPQGMIHQIKIQLDTDLEKSLEICGMDAGGFGHATRVNQIITELLQSTSSSHTAECVNDGSHNTPTATTPIPPLTPATLAGNTAATANANAIANPAETTKTVVTTTITKAVSRHTIYIVSDAPQFIFQDVIALGAIYRNAKVDAGVVQPLAYSVDRQKTIEGVKSFLARRDEMIKHEVSWLAQVGANCVLADAPFLPCAAADAYGIPACLITNFTFDEVYRFLREGDPSDKDVIACADAALEDYKKASLLLRLPGSIDIPSFADEILTLEAGVPIRKGSTATTTAVNLEKSDISPKIGDLSISSPSSELQGDTKGSDQLLNGLNNDLHPVEHSRKNPQLSVDTSVITRSSRPIGLQRRAIDVPLVVRKAINTREDVLRSLGVDEETIRTKKMVLVSFGGQRLKQGWGNPLPDGWIGVICGLPVSHELPEGFYRSPHGVYVPDLTHAADIVIGKLGYGTCSECIAHDTALIYVSRPQFIEEHGLIKMMINHGLPVEMTAEEFETGLWQRSILEADRLAQEEREGRRLFLLEEEESNTTTTTTTIFQSPTSDRGGGGAFSAGSFSAGAFSAGLPLQKGNSLKHEKSLVAQKRSSSGLQHIRVSKAKSLAESVNMAEMARGGPISPIVNDDDPPLMSPARSRRSASITSLTSATFRSRTSSGGGLSNRPRSGSFAAAVDGIEDWLVEHELQMQKQQHKQQRQDEEEGIVQAVHPQPEPWFERRIPHDGGKVCAQLVEEYMLIWDQYHPQQ
ncbi:hypothetical protein BGX26_012532 [Mortierella sp. AD094]|nr:hypothetical protein BGX26_012532 [Mortierella sp. AD094]